MHDSFRIDAEKNIYFQNSVSNKACNVIDFAAWNYNLSNTDAIKMLAEGLNGEPAHNEKGTFARKQAEAAQEPKPPFVLPEQSPNGYKRVFAYLTHTRSIDRGIVQEMIDRGFLYQDVRGNASFVGYNEAGEPAFCFQRGTYDAFGHEPYKHVVPGSDFNKCLYVDNGASQLFISEAAIDNMSVMNMLKMHGLDYHGYDYLATCGGSTQSAIRQVAAKPGLKTIYLAFDNDAAGNDFRNTFKTALREHGFNGRIVDKPPHLKDFNQDLTAIKEAAPQRQAAPKSNQPNPIIKTGVSMK